MLLAYSARSKSGGMVERSQAGLYLMGGFLAGYVPPQVLLCLSLWQQAQSTTHLSSSAISFFGVYFPHPTVISFLPW